MRARQQPATRDRDDLRGVAVLKQLGHDVDRGEAGAGKQHRRIRRDLGLLLDVPRILDDQFLHGRREAAAEHARRLVAGRENDDVRGDRLTVRRDDFPPLALRRDGVRRRMQPGHAHVRAFRGSAASRVCR